VLALHASAVATPAGALLFLGHSGAGKSTICRLLNLHATPLADDAVYLFRGDDQTWRVADASHRAFAGPLSESAADELTGKHLFAIFRLYQSAIVKVVPAGQSEICRHLADALFEIGWQQWIDSESKRKLFASLAQVARSHSAARLYFTLRNETSVLVSEYVFRATNQEWKGPLERWSVTSNPVQFRSGPARSFPGKAPWLDQV
jgi:energy-coupling factor transporter ATP-binding protein EcfA2